MENISVSIRIKPLDLSSNEDINTNFEINNNSLINIKTSEKLVFDNIITEETTNKQIFDEIVQPNILELVTKGINATIFSYGQTSTGKTHTMIGYPNEPGIIPMTIDSLFSRLDLNDSSVEIKVRL